jgi:hypothetical protein
MRFLLALAICGLTAPLFAQSPAPSTKAAKIERMMELTNSQASVDQMVAQIFKMIPSTVPPDASPEVKAKIEETHRRSIDLIKQQMNWQRMKPRYAKLFTAEELDGMVAFYESPVGQSMLKKMPELVKRSMALGQNALNEIAPELKRLQKEAGAK